MPLIEHLWDVVGDRVESRRSVWWVRRQERKRAVPSWVNNISVCMKGSPYLYIHVALGCDRSESTRVVSWPNVQRCLQRNMEYGRDWGSKLIDQWSARGWRHCRHICWIWCRNACVWTTHPCRDWLVNVDWRAFRASQKDSRAKNQRSKLERTLARNKLWI